MNILIATDAWHPQVNGVVRTVDQVSKSLVDLGHAVELITPKGRRSLGLPGYKEIRLTWIGQKEISKIVEHFQPDAIHIATEGPIGWAMRRWCLKNKRPFTTSYHTQFPEYVAMRLPLPGVAKIAYALLRHFHRHSLATLTPTRSTTRLLEKNGFQNVVTWTRGVDHTLFRPVKSTLHQNLAKPVMTYMGRVAVEKGLSDFLEADVAGTKVIIGDGPSREMLEKQYPDAIFRGYKFGEELTAELCACDLFVFPSKTDTFGLVLLEAMACGLPVAGYPVTGPIDVVTHGKSGWLDDDLSVAIANASTLKPEDAIAHAAQFTWRNTAQIFCDNLVPVDRAKPLRAPKRLRKSETRSDGPYQSSTHR